MNSSFNSQHSPNNSISSGLSLSYYLNSGTPAPAPLSFPANAARVNIAQMKLADLLVNQHVEELLNKWTEANRAAMCYIKEQHHLLLKVSTLQNTVFALRTELAEVQRKLQE